MQAHGKSLTDWKAAEQRSDEDVERLADDEDGGPPEGWADSVVLGLPPRKQAVSVRLDADVLEWFRAQGPGYQTKINAVLRSFVNAKR
jgi:uncharacterized protein (DUF4415 family)